MVDGSMRENPERRHCGTEGIFEADGIETEGPPKLTAHMVKALDMLTAPGKDFLITTFE